MWTVSRPLGIPEKPKWARIVRLGLPAPRQAKCLRSPMAQGALTGIWSVDSHCVDTSHFIQRENSFNRQLLSSIFFHLCCKSVNPSETDFSMTPLVYLVCCQKYVSCYTCRVVARPSHRHIETQRQNQAPFFPILQHTQHLHVEEKDPFQ